MAKQKKKAAKKKKAKLGPRKKTRKFGKHSYTLKKWSTSKADINKAKAAAKKAGKKCRVRKHKRKGTFQYKLYVRG